MSDALNKANDGNILIFAKEIVTNEVQVDNGNLGIGGAELNRDAGKNGTVHQEQGVDIGGVYDDRGRSETNGTVGQSEILDANTRSEEQGVQAEVKTAESENGYTITDDTGSRIITIKFEGKPNNEVRAIAWQRTSNGEK